MALPNIVFFCTDQQRFDSLGCCGNPAARTPNLDRMAARGTRFERHTVPCQICSPSRASMFTGLYPRSHRLYSNGIALDPSIPTLAQALTRQGYSTCGLGKFHFQPILAPASLEMPESRAFWTSGRGAEWSGPFYGFQSVEFLIGDGPEMADAGHYGRWLRETHPEGADLYRRENALEPPPSDTEECWKCAIPAAWHYNTWLADRALAFLDRVTEPFFLFVSFPDPHPPLAPPAPYCNRYDPEELPKPRAVPGELEKMPPYYLRPPHPEEQGNLQLAHTLSPSTLRQIIAHTYGMVEMVDDCVGRVMEGLEARGKADETVALFTADHGDLLGDHGLLHKGPPPYRQLLEVPLVMQGPGVSSGHRVDGLTSHVDLMPTLLELAGATADETHLEGTSLAPLLDASAREARPHVFCEYHPRAARDLYNQTVRTREWRLTIYPEHGDWGEFFDLSSDPFEHHNRYADPSLRSVRDELRAVLAREFPPRPATDEQRLCKW